jgi:hypothetical protein
VSQPDPAKKLCTLLHEIAGGAEPADPWQEGRPESCDPLLWHLVFSFMAWEAGTGCAVAANRCLHEAIVDYNELRVCLVDEVVSILGPSYPRVRDRAIRLRAVLGDIFRREQCVQLSHIPALGRREARIYIETLEGMAPFVSGRLALLSLDAHAFPLDERLQGALLEVEALPPDLDVIDAAAWLERQVRAGEAAAAYMLLEAWNSKRVAHGGGRDPKARMRRRTSG